MPTYEYRCKDCGEHIEVVQAFTDDPLMVCPNCEGQLRKVFSSIGITFKGSGFYRTDSRKSAAAAKSPKESTSGESKSTQSSGGSTEGGSTEGGAKQGGAKDSSGSGESKGSSSSSEAKTA